MKISCEFVFVFCLCVVFNGRELLKGRMSTTYEAKSALIAESDSEE